MQEAEIPPTGGILDTCWLVRRTGLEPVTLGLKALVSYQVSTSQVRIRRMHHDMHGAHDHRAYL